MPGVVSFIAKTLATKVGTSTVGSLLTTGLQIGGTALSVAGTLRAGEQAETASTLQSTQALQESTIAEEQALDELLKGEEQALQEEIRGEEETRLKRKEGKKLEAKQRAQFAKSGVRVGVGSPLLIFAETLLDEEEDVLAIRESAKARATTLRGTARSRALSLRNQADVFRSGARSFRDIGKGAVSASRTKAGVSLLSGISDIIT